MKLNVTLLALGMMLLGVTHSSAFTVRGTGSGALKGNDLTDTDGTHNETAYNPPGDFGGFDAEFFSSNESFFNGAEGAFNVFDDAVGGGSAKWCCGVLPFRRSSGPGSWPVRTS